MHPADIKAALQKANKPPARVAEKLGVPPSTVSQVIHGKCKSQKVALQIASIVGKPVSVLWPGMYPHLEFQERLMAA